MIPWAVLWTVRFIPPWQPGSWLSQQREFNRLCQWKGGSQVPRASSLNLSWKWRVVRWCQDKICCLTFVLQHTVPNLSSWVSLAGGKGEVSPSPDAASWANRRSPQGPKALWYFKLSLHIDKIMDDYALHIKGHWCRNWYRHFMGPFWQIMCKTKINTASY